MIIIIINNLFQVRGGGGEKEGDMATLVRKAFSDVLRQLGSSGGEAQHQQSVPINVRLFEL